jgi:hypothetical protein
MHIFRIVLHTGNAVITSVLYFKVIVEKYLIHIPFSWGIKNDL